MLPVAALIGAILYRARGGVLKDWFPGFGTQASRLVWAIPTAALMTEMSHAPLWLLPALIVSVFTATALFGTGQYLPANMERQFPDLLGFYRNALAGLPLFYYGPLMFGLYAATGFFHGLFYWIGHRTGYDSRAGECIVGAVSWSIIVLCR